MPLYELGYATTELRRRLVAAVLAGKKTATSGLADDSEPPGRPGDRFALLDVDDRPVAIVETMEVRIVQSREIDLAFARDEGEGFESVEDWRAAHEEFFEQPIRDDALIVAERFHVVERL